MELLSLVPATALGYLTLRATTHPKARIRRKLPSFQYKRAMFFPVIRIRAFGRIFHLHHWMSFSLLLAISGPTSFGILDHSFTRGILLGGIIQGLTVPKEYRKIIYRDFRDKLTIN